MLEKLKMLLGISGTDKDDLLTLLIDQATENAVEYTHADIASLQSVIIKMAIYDYNRLDNIGLDSEAYSGVSFNYSNDYPEDILRLLRKKRRIIIR